MRADETIDPEVDAAESELVRAMLAGSETAFDRFAADYVPPLWRYAVRRLGDRELASDIVQATTVKAISKLDSFRGESALATWLCAICAHEIADHFRHRARAGVEVELTESIPAGSGRQRVALASPDPVPEASLLERERAGLVHATLDALPPRYARVIEWMYLERLPVRQIAGRLGVGPKAAESLLTRSREAFRKVYRRLGGLPGTARAGAMPGGGAR